MFIPDGYAQRVVVGDVSCIFRPAIEIERAEVGRVALQQPEFLEVFLESKVIDLRSIDSKLSLSQVRRRFYGEPGTWEKLADAILGIPARGEERGDVLNLYQGSVIRLSTPWLSKPPCRYCMVKLYDPLTNETAVVEGGMRPQSVPPLCLVNETFGEGTTTDKCPLGDCRNPITLSPKNRAAFEFDSLCRAANQWPDDPIVLRNAGVIGKAIRDLHDRRRKSSRG